MNTRKIILTSLFFLLGTIALNGQSFYPDTVRTLIQNEEDFLVYFYASWAPIDSIKTKEYPVIYLKADEYKE